MLKRLHDGDHPDLARSLNNLALLYSAQGSNSQALASLTQATEIEEAILAENLLIGSEQQKQQFLDKFDFSTNYTISFHLQTLPQQEDAARLALTTILRRKGRVLDAMGRALRTLRDQLDPTSQQLFAQLASTQTQLANLSARPGNPQPTQDQRKQLAEKIDSLQAQLSQRSAAFAQETTPVTISAVQDAIPQNAALIEFIQYSPYDPKTEESDAPRYAVYVLQPDGTLQWRDLGDAATINQKAQCLNNLLNQSKGRGVGAVPVVEGCDTNRQTSNLENVRAVARELDEITMAPVRELIGEATHLLLSPDSELNLVPFAALVDEQNQYLVERYQITYLTSGRDLLRVQYRDQPPQESLMLAYPDYDDQGILAQTPETESNPTVATVPENERGRRSSELTALEFSALSGTLAEAEALEPMIDDLALFTEEQASENTLKQWKRPRILHLATHGFFLSSQTSNNPEETLSNQENPLLRSGLALAGFNERQSGEEDGVLTALEVTGLNLRGTRLVVLSACETGVGETRAGEGVYGLRRAFTLAGAESQLMSLWNVSDEGTQELMVAYYQRLLNGEGRSEALRQVQLEMLQEEERSHPFFWAAFIPSGAWTPLD
jgi:CHAT domain-containing protein